MYVYDCLPIRYCPVTLSCSHCLLYNSISCTYDDTTVHNYVYRYSCSYKHFTNKLHIHTNIHTTNNLHIHTFLKYSNTVLTLPDLYLGKRHRMRMYMSPVIHIEDIYSLDIWKSADTMQNLCISFIKKSMLQ